MAQCIHCGGELPEGAAFCPHCETILTEKAAAKPPRLWRKTLLLGGILGCLLLALLAGGLAVHRAIQNAPPPHEPQVYYGEEAECLYESDGVTYHLLLSFDVKDWIPDAQADRMIYLAPSAELGYKNHDNMPSTLFVYQEADRDTCREEFLALLDSYEVEAVPTEESQAMECTQIQEDRSSPYAVLRTGIEFDLQDGCNNIRWTLHMKNGDVIHMSHRFTVREKPILIYRPEDTPLNTAEELQTLLDEITDTVTDRLTEVHIYLPSVTYDGPIIMRRACYLHGAQDGETTFTRGMLVQGLGDLRVTFDKLTFAGSGSGSGRGLASQEPLILTQCTFKDWDIGAAGQETAWISAQSCTFQRNGVGLLLNCTYATSINYCFARNRFEDNGTGLHIEHLPDAWTLDLSQTVFTGNETDIANVAGYRLDTSETIFQ